MSKASLYIVTLAPLIFIANLHTNVPNDVQSRSIL